MHRRKGLSPPYASPVLSLANAQVCVLWSRRPVQQCHLSLLMYTKRAKRLSPVFESGWLVNTAEDQSAATAIVDGQHNVFFRQDDLVWISHKREAWVPGKVISVLSQSKLIVQGVGTHYANDSLTINLAGTKSDKTKQKGKLSHIRRFRRLQIEKRWIHKL